MTQQPYYARLALQEAEAEMARCREYVKAVLQIDAKVIHARHCLCDSKRASGGEPPKIEVGVPEEVVKALRGPVEKMTHDLFLVVAPRPKELPGVIMPGDPRWP